MQYIERLNKIFDQEAPIMCARSMRWMHVFDDHAVIYVYAYIYMDECGNHVGYSVDYGSSRASGRSSEQLSSFIGSLQDAKALIVAAENILKKSGIS